MQARIASLLLALALALGASISQAQTPEQNALLQLERDTAKAWLTADVKFVDAVEAADYVFTSPTGAVTGKTEDVESLKAGFKFTVFTLDDMKARIFDKAAVVTGRVTLKGTYLKEVYDGAYRFTDTFVWRDGRWQIVASQNTSIAKN
jgi:hypothetical protein